MDERFWFSDRVWLTDSGLETDLIFRRGFELPLFAAFPLLNNDAGHAALSDYYREHIDVAEQHGCDVVLESATWRANSDWAARLGCDRAALRQANESAVRLLDELRTETARTSPISFVVSGCVGPRSDGYLATDRMTSEGAEQYHRDQVETLAAAGADMVHAMTLTYPAEAIGIIRAAAAAGIPVAVSFTTETDGRLPDGTTLGDTIAAVDAATDNYAAHYGVNCAHPTHFAAALPDDDRAMRLRSVRANASRMSHAELDEAPELDAGDPIELAIDYRQLRDRHPTLTVLGGCCGTDVRHVAAIADRCLS
jgi:homocysteine S-methyltransferase